MALRQDMPTQDPDYSDPEHAREYDPATGGWTKPVADTTDDED